MSQNYSHKGRKEKTIESYTSVADVYLTTNLGLALYFQMYESSDCPGLCHSAQVRDQSATAAKAEPGRSSFGPET